MATIETQRGNIVDVEADAIVNAANGKLAPGGGVCGEIFKAAGYDKLNTACRALGGCPVGQAKTTPAFDLEKRGIKYIIHAVGPRWSDHSPEEADALLAGAYGASLAEAEKHGLSSIAFPTISTGIFGFPKDRAAEIAVRVCRNHAGNLDKIILVAFDAENEQILKNALGQ